MNTHFITRSFGSLLLGLVLLAAMFVPSESEAKKLPAIGFQVFYDELSPYGDWVKDARHGYIWLPAVRGDFHPYGTEGHWVMTEYGNTWVSYYDWGWAPFHYGRWYYDDYFQSWAWIPGYEWGPAWVNWRTGGGYYGWAPLGPGLSIQVSMTIPTFHWVFIPNHRIHHHYAYRYYAPHKTKVKIYNNTTIINNTVVYNNRTYVGGPQRRELERVTRTSVPVYNVQGGNAPGRAAVSRGSVTLYRPEVEESRGRTTDVRPSRVLDAQQAKTARSSRELNSSTPSRSSAPSVNSGGRSVESSPRSIQSPGATRNSSTPSRSASPSVKEGSNKPVITPMPDNPSNRSRTSTPSRSQSSGSREAAPSRSSESTRTQQAPARGTVEQSRPTQAPARTQSPQVRSSAPARSQSSRPSSEVKSSSPERKSSSSSGARTSGSTASRSSNKERNN